MGAAPALAVAAMSDEVLAELRALKPSELKRRAREAGVGEDAMDEAADAADPKEALLALVVAATGGADPAPGADIVESEQEPEAGDEEAPRDQEPAPDAAADAVPEGVPPSGGGITRELLNRLGISIGWDDEMVEGTLSAMDGDLEQCAALLREQGATESTGEESVEDTEPQPEREPEPEPEQEPTSVHETEHEQPDDEQERVTSEDAKLDEAKNSLFAGAASKKKKSEDAALDAAKDSLFAGAKTSKNAAAADEDAALVEAKGALFAGSAKKPKAKAKDTAKSADSGLGLARDNKEPAAEEPVRSLDDLDAGDMSMMTVDEDLSIPQARLESGKTYYQILWVEQGGNEHDVWRRYSEFDSLRKKMSGKKGGHPEIKTLHFPGKTKIKSKGNSENIVDDRQGHLQAWLQQLVMAKQLEPDSEGDNAQKMLYDFLSGDSEPEFHRMMTNGGPNEGTMKAIGNYD